MFTRRPRTTGRRHVSGIETLECRRLLAAAGDLDTSFSGDGIVIAPDDRTARTAVDAAVQTDGKLVVAGAAGDFVRGPVRLMVARYNTNGTPDTTFGNAPDGRVLTTLPGKLVYAGGLAVLPGGKILVAAAHQAD